MHTLITGGAGYPSRRGRGPDLRHLRTSGPRPRRLFGTPMHTLITGGAGYIGSHTCLALLEVGHPSLQRAFAQPPDAVIHFAAAEHEA